MANGFVPNLLRSLEAYTNPNYPGKKVTPPGFTRLLLENKPSSALVTNQLRVDEQGHIRDVKLKYQVRSIPSQTSTVDSCDVDIVPGYREVDVPTLNFRKLSFYIPDSIISRYGTETSTQVQLGSPKTALMEEFLSSLLTQLNGLIGAIDQDLLSAMATRWGKNIVTGSSAATNISFDPNNLSMNNGVVKLMSDAVANELIHNGQMLVAGNGMLLSYMIAKQFQTATNSNGFTNESAGIKYYDDIYSAASWGANIFGVFAPYSVGLIEANSYAGNFGGLKGGSYFFTLPIPIQISGGTLTPLVLDAQLKYVDCPTDVIVEGATQKINRGWVLMLSKRFALFTLPDDAYQSGDRLHESNGTLLYSAV